MAVAAVEPEVELDAEARHYADAEPEAVLAEDSSRGYGAGASAATSLMSGGEAFGSDNDAPDNPASHRLRAQKVKAQQRTKARRGRFKIHRSVVKKACDPGYFA